VQDEQNPVSRPVSDFYVFLLQLLSQTESCRDLGKLETLGELLKIESETWRMVVQQLPRAEDQSEPSPTGHITGINLLANNWNPAEMQGGLNLEL
jgi:hypothetical protein